MAAATTVIARTWIEGVHYWPHAPEHVWYLGEPHRHNFLIEVEAPVTHDDRDIEFITLAHDVDAALRRRFPSKRGVVDFDTWSCEAIAREVLQAIPSLVSCAVYEDGENGAKVIR